MRGILMRWARPAIGLALLTAAIPQAAATPLPCVAATEKRVLAAPPVTGPFGPWRQVTAAVTRPAGNDTASFDVRLRLPTGRCLTLVGMDDPNELFLFEVRSARLVPLPGTRGNGLVVLFHMSQIGPGHGTDRVALAYRVAGAGPPIDRRIDRRVIAGARSIADVTRALRRRR